LKPLGAPIVEADLAKAKRDARKIGAPAWAVTNGLRLQGAQSNQKFNIELRAIARVEGSFDQLIQLAAKPSDFINTDEVQADDADG
jgi:hypothetical protein